MRKRRFSLIVLTLVLAACGGESRGDTNGIVGMWQRTLPNAVGPGLRIQMEIHRDGSYVVHAPG